MQHAIVSQKEWLTARKALLAKEKEFTKARDQLSEARRSLPWVKVEKNYVFEGHDGRRNACRPVRRQESSSSSITSCSARAGCTAARVAHSSPIISTAPIVHLAHRDVTLVVVSRAPLAEIDSLQEAHGLEIQMGVVTWQRLQPRLPCLVHAGGKWLAGAEYNYAAWREFPARKRPA